MSTLTQLAREISITDLLIPPSTYLTDRRISEDVFVAGATGKRAFATRDPFPTSSNGSTRFPRVLRETTSFILMDHNVVTEGLFRVPPHSKLRDCLKEAYDRGQKYIVWKDNDCILPLPPYPQAEHQNEILAEVVPTDAYSVFMACAMIKAWYASLRYPIFSTDSYRDLKRLYGDPHDFLDLDRLRDLFSPTSEWSLLSGASREITVRHLLPLLSAIAARQEQNKMTAENLAVCFAPGLLCGPDQLEDAKMSSIIRRLFTQAIDMWTEGLREACGQSEEAFYSELKLPKDENDWEDPLPGKQGSASSWSDSLEEHTRGITLEDNEKQSAYAEPPRADSYAPPPLPPRAQTSKASVESTKRKPAPALQVPPRYSTVISDAPEDVAESPLTYAATTDGFAPRQPNNNVAPPPAPQWSTDEKKSGTNNTVSVSAPIPYHSQGHDAPRAVDPIAPQLNIPKRKTLTATQIDNVEKSVVAQEEVRHVSPSGSQAPHGGFALPGLTSRPSSNISSKRASPSAYAHSEASISPTSVVSAPIFDLGSRRPSIPASTNTNRSPSFTSLARPVYPALPTMPTIHQPPIRSPSLPNPSSPSNSNFSPGSSGPRLRAPSAALLQRMPSFDKGVIKEDEGCRAVGRTLAPKKLNLKKQSVEDLRRLYEERAGTASAIVEAGRQR